MSATRYDRMMRIPEIGLGGQERIARSRVLLVGVGGLGCASAPWLVRAGVGTLILVDPGEVDLPDLGRQLLYRDEHIGQKKAVVAATDLRRMNPQVTVEGMPIALDESSVAILGRNVDVIVDGTDALAPRIVMNAYSVKTGTPVVFGGAVGWAGNVLTVAPGSACRECVFRDAPSAAICSEAGVFGPVVGLVGALQAAEVLRLVMGLPCPPSGNLQSVDLLHGTMRRILTTRNEDCPVCGIH